MANLNRQGLVRPSWLCLIAVLSNLVAPGAAAQDSGPPSIDIAYDTTVIGDTWVTWNFTTDERARCTVEWGETSAYGQSVNESGFATNHSLTMDGLLPGRVYRFRIVAVDAEGNSNETDEMGVLTFDTRPDPGVPLWGAATVMVAICLVTFLAARKWNPRCVGAYSGLAAVATIGVTLPLAVFLTPTFRVGIDYPSDLGVAGHGTVFNWALVVAASLSMPFAWFGVRPALEGRFLPTAGALTATVVGAAGLLVGVFSLRDHDAHLLFSQVTFVGVMATGILWVVPLWKSPLFGRINGIFSVLLMVADGILLAFGNGTNETMAIFAFVAWLLVTSAQLLRARPPAPLPGASVQAKAR